MAPSARELILHIPVNKVCYQNTIAIKSPNKGNAIIKWIPPLNVGVVTRENTNPEQKESWV